MKHPLSLLAPCLLGGCLLVGQASAADLVPPRGYYAPVDIDDKKPEACKAPPQPYTAKLDFRSKYEGSDKARATLNPEAEKAFREKTADITEMERGFKGHCPFTSLADVYAAAFDAFHGGKRQRAFELFGAIQAASRMVSQNNIQIMVARGVFKPGTRGRTAPLAPGSTPALSTSAISDIHVRGCQCPE